MNSDNNKNHVQNGFLKLMQQNKTEVEIALIDGEKMIGLIHDYDQETVLMKTSTSQHLIYKNSICYIHEI